MAKRILPYGIALFLGILPLILTGCRKEPPPQPEVPNATAEQLARQQDFKNTPGAVICDLAKVKLDAVEMPENEPYFIRNLRRNNEDTLLQGELKIGQTDYVVLLPLEQNFSSMAFYPKASRRSPYWWGADKLESIHKIDGKFYEFCTLDGCTRFAARPYTGPTGLFKVGKGTRQVKTLAMNGSVTGQQYTAPVGDLDEFGWTENCAECRLPVGDYYPAIMSVAYDNISITISNNYHRDQSGKEMGTRPRVYGFKVRSDAPCVLDFSNEPVVIFDEPAPDANRFKRGDEVKFAAVLVDPELDIMIRGLRDTSVEVEKEFTDSDGTKHTFKQDKSLDPTVTIARADGSVVAEGVMPFG